ncbi:hypothetical protein [Spiroplasma endosymbiont of Asaphidion curtum]|uniref:hypothetical protein n=1 Tax=Spiroplasma endosymbiont of Asaphidion curtum TaxID=3066281 RepID=UPI00313E24C1
MKKLLNLLSAVNLVVIELISVVSCGSESKVKKNVTETPKSVAETINHEPGLEAPKSVAETINHEPGLEAPKSVAETINHEPGLEAPKSVAETINHEPGLEAPKSVAETINHEPGLEAPKSVAETINHEPDLGASNSNNFKFDISEITKKEIFLDETSNDEFLTKQSILETDISEKVKRAILELLKKINNSLTENDFIVDFSQNFPVDIRNKTNIFIKAKISEKNNNNNNVEIIINIKRKLYANVKIISIESPQKIIANDPKKVTKEELKTALLPEILKSLEKLNPGFPNTVNKNYISIKKFEIEDINFPLDLSSEKILTKLNINFKFMSGMIPIAVFAPKINLNNFKLPMALKN